jgi:hypothetical protein
MDNVHITKKTKPITIASPIQPYSLKNGLFDPIQNSPPSVWKARLMNRINNTGVLPTPTRRLL